MSFELKPLLLYRVLLQPELLVMGHIFPAVFELLLVDQLVFLSAYIGES
jgi:hypothetical protein